MWVCIDSGPPFARYLETMLMVDFSLARSGWIVSLMGFNIRMRSGDDMSKSLRSMCEMQFDIRGEIDFDFRPWDTF